MTMPVKIKQQGEESQCAEEAQEANGEKEEEVEGMGRRRRKWRGRVVEGRWTAGGHGAEKSGFECRGGRGGGGTFWISFGDNT
jgi:hypothetical protein